MSATKDTVIRVHGEGFTYNGPIGKFIDKLLEQTPDKVITIGHDSVVMNLEKDIKIIGVSNDEKTSWKQISQVSRHPANGGLVKVTSLSGKTTTATLSHSFLKRTENGIEPILGSELKVGDRVPVVRNIPTVENALTEVKIGDKMEKLDKELGWFVGAYLADGGVHDNVIVISKTAKVFEERLLVIAKRFAGNLYIKQSYGAYGPSKDMSFSNYGLARFLEQNFSTGSFKKIVGALVFGSNLEFISGILSGYFDGDGNTNAPKQMIRCGSRSQHLINDMCVLLAYCGIFASVREERTVNQPGKVLYTLQVQKKYAQQFKSVIGFNMPEKAQGLDDIIAYNNDSTERNDVRDEIDMIPALGQTIATIGKALEMPGQSRTYGRWLKKEAVGRRTLAQYIEQFEAANDAQARPDIEVLINKLKCAYNGNVVWDRIVSLDILDDPNEYVYDFTVPGNDSFMVDTGVVVHNTLNSVDWHTELLLDVDGKLQRVEIGDFIDKEIEAATRKEHHPNDTTLGWVEHKNIKVLSCDEDGHIDWQLVEAVTKHPPINKDGTNTLLKVVTDSGRSVIATKAKSFLKRVNNKIVEVPGEEIKVGDYLPVSNKLTINRAITHWDVSDTLSKHDFVFMTEVDKAKEIHKNKTSRWWFSKCQGKDFTVPYSRSDCFVDAFIGIGQREPRREQIIKQRDGCVYPKTCIRQPAHIPEMIPLDAEFGFFVGAYLAEGNCTDYHTMISNIDDNFNARIEQFCARYDIGYHVIDKVAANGGRSKTIRMHSQVLTQMMSKNCGRVSYEKRIPAELLAAPDVFLRNMVDGYMSGDGTVSQKDNRICASSVSKGLLEDFQQVFTQYGIQTKIHAVPSALKIALEKGMDAHMSYCLSIATAYVEAYRSLFAFTLAGKQEKLENMTSVAEFSRCDTIPDVVTKKFGTITVHRSRIDDLISMCADSPEDVQILNDIKTEDIIYDKIVSVEEIPSSHDHVYDLTVANTRNFNIWNGLACKDTFHLSGVASASKSVRGVPRIEELTRVTKNVKAPSMTVFIRPEFSQDKTKCLEIKNKLEITTFKDIIKFSRIYYDADDFKTDIAEDQRLVQLYAEYNFDLEGETNNKNLSPWLLRMELDKAKMLDIGLNMIDLHHIMYDHFQSRVSCMFSDDNAGDLVFRIRLNQETNGKDANADKSSDMLTDLKALESTIIETIMLKGIEKVKKVELIKKDGLKYNPDTQVFEKKFEWALDTDGTNLMEMLGSPYIDPYRTVSNDINEIYAIFGVEAARQALFNELNSVIKDAEASVNFRHLSLLVDTMTLKGGLMSIDRHGINKGDIGPLAKCSFEEVNDVLVKAGVFAEVDRVNGVSANIILGQIAPCGTGDTEILIDEQKLKAPSKDRTEGHAFNTSMLQFDDEQKGAFCGTDNLGFDFAMPDADMSIQKKPSVAVKFV